MAGCSCIDIFVLPVGHPDIDDTAYRDALINTIKPHVQIFLSMNTWMFETCRRQYKWFKSLMKNVYICWFLLHKIFHFAFQCYIIYKTFKCLWHSLSNKYYISPVQDICYNRWKICLLYYGEKFVVVCKT